MIRLKVNRILPIRCWRYNLKESKNGVYLIRQKSTGLVYVGMSKQMSRRWNWHTCMLDKNEHHCAALQEAWNANGRGDFEKVVLESSDEYDRAKLKELEQKYLDIYRGKLLNTQTDSFVQIWTEESRKRASESAKLRCKDPEYLRNISERVKQQHANKNFGHHTWSEEYKSVPIGTKIHTS